MKQEAGRSIKMVVGVPVHQMAWCYIPLDGNLQSIIRFLVLKYQE